MSRSNRSTKAQPTMTHTHTHTFADDTVPTPVPLDVLFGILQLQRFAGSVGEQALITCLKTRLAEQGVVEDGYGNLIVRLPKADGTPSATLFSCHTDTVEKQKATGLKELEQRGVVLTTRGGGVLGADDGAGVFVLLNLIASGVPGLYIFHREEEIGGGGSSHIADKTPWVLDGIERAVAFDRKGTTDVINFQGGSRCASDTFAEALAAGLNTLIEGAECAPDDGGSFTDTKNYTALVPECTNLCVGYHHQHTTEECLDLSFLTRLVNACVALDWEALPTERDPSAVEEEENLWNRWTSWTSYRDMPAPSPLDKMEAFIESHPRGVALLLLQLGYEPYELRQVAECYEEQHEEGLIDDDGNLIY